MVGVHTVIDCATARPEESTNKIDWEAKVALIQCAQAMGIQRYLFFSIYNCEKYPEVPLMNIKSCTEKFLASRWALGIGFRASLFLGSQRSLISYH